MRSKPTVGQWLWTISVSTLLSTMLANPVLLPDPLRPKVETAVNGAARVWLWVWDQPITLEGPDGTWGIRSSTDPFLNAG